MLSKRTSFYRYIKFYQLLKDYVLDNRFKFYVIESGSSEGGLMDTANGVVHDIIRMMNQE